MLFGLPPLNATVCQWVFGDKFSCFVLSSSDRSFFGLVSKMASQASQNKQTRSSKAKPQATASTSAAAAAASENNSAVELLLPVCNNNNNNNTLARWPLSKYSNFIISQRPGVGTWQERTAGEPHDMWIQITQVRTLSIIMHTRRFLCFSFNAECFFCFFQMSHQPFLFSFVGVQRRYIQILHGDVLLECINLSEAQGVWKAIRYNQTISTSNESFR